MVSGKQVNSNDQYMDKNLKTDGKVLAFATYKPKEGKHEELMALVRNHLPILKQYGLASEKEGYLAIAQDGTIVEVFEWVSASATDAAHQHPAVLDIWEKMMLVADFVPMHSLQEGKRPFPGFAIIE